MKNPRITPKKVHELAEDAYFNSQSMGHQESLDAVVNLVIEECARVVEDGPNYANNSARHAAAAIRALKDKPQNKD